ncbi:GRP family sugar transporter, partial [Staphylococcus epidermidis]|uniref:GRP family sugar transporter n=1 Tax=Staphylococcus epidermidis TaxID=1282 RepID=UPI001C92EED3
IYSPPPQPTDIPPFKPFLPQPIPILILPLIYPFMNISKPNPFKHKLTSQQIISPFFFPFPPLTYLISPQPNMNPLPTPFVLSQTSLL